MYLNVLCLRYVSTDFFQFSTDFRNKLREILEIDPLKVNNHNFPSILPPSPSIVPGTVKERQGPRGRRVPYGAEGEMAPGGDPGANAQRQTVPTWEIVGIGYKHHTYLTSYIMGL